MKKNVFEIPLLVRYDGRHYEISTVFQAFPNARGERFKEVLTDFEQNFKKNYRNTIVAEYTIGMLTMFRLNPDVKLTQPQFEFKVSQQLVYQKFTVASFYIDNKLIVILPDFNFHTFIADQSDLESNPVETQIEHFIKSYMRQEAEHQNKDLNPEPFRARRNEFITVIEIMLNIKNENPSSPFKSVFSAAFRDDTSFDGTMELSKVGFTLNDLYPNKLKSAYFSDEIVEKLILLLFERDFAAIALVGELGTGRTSMLHEATYKYIERYKESEGKIEKKLNREIHFIDPNHIISGMSIVGQWQKRLTAIIETIIRKGRKRKARQCDILYTDNPVAFFRVGRSSMNSMTLSSLIKPYIEKRQLPFIIEATPEEWRIVGQLDRRFADLFQVIRVNEPGFEKALDIAAKKRIELEGGYEAKLNHDGLYKLFTMQRKYMRNNALPGSLIKQMERLAVKYNELISNEKLDDEIRELTRIKQHQLSDGILKHADISETLQKKLIGQQDAIESLCNIIQILNADLNDPNKPMVSALFIGPTGVGKTQAAKVLAEYLFESDSSLVRFDMNEFIDGGAVSRLIGNFYNPEGQLVGTIRHNPHCVLLFDEIEKANPDVLDLLLQVLGEGRLTDSLGRTVDFSNTIIIMTSNLGADNAGRELGYVKNEHSLSQIYQKAIGNFFRPEMLNRIDEIVIFQRLKMGEIISIANLLFAEILNREGFLRRTTILRIHQNVLKAVAERGFDPTMGARSLKRNIEKEIIELTADYLSDIQSNAPILIELFLQKNKLVPRVTPFENVKLIDKPLIPDFGFKNNRKAYLELFSDLLTDIENEIYDFRDEMDEYSDSETDSMLKRHDLLTLQDEIRKLRIRIEERLYEIVKRYRHIPTPKNYYKLHSFHSLQQGITNDNHSEKFLSDVHNQLHVNEYFSEKYVLMNNSIEDDIADYTEFFVKLTYFQYFWEGFAANDINQFFIKIEPLKAIEGFSLNISQLPFMRLWNEFQFTERIEPDKKQKNKDEYSLVYMKGPGLYNLLKHEEGLHIFINKNNRYPVLVSLIELPDDFDIKLIRKHEITATDALHDQLNRGVIEMDKLPALNGRIVRYYDQYASDSKNNLTTDLRTGTICRGEIMTQQDAELIFTVNIPDELKPLDVEGYLDVRDLIT